MIQRAHKSPINVRLCRHGNRPTLIQMLGRREFGIGPAERWWTECACCDHIGARYDTRDEAIAAWGLESQSRVLTLKRRNSP